jgi:hypothetical protein
MSGAAAVISVEAYAAGSAGTEAGGLGVAMGGEISGAAGLAGVLVFMHPADSTIRRQIKSGRRIAGVRMNRIFTGWRKLTF